ncbi:MAG: hypothetical protein AAB696_00140 [Patescibacteria group bacterium]
MQVIEFRSKIKSNLKLTVEDKEFIIKEVVKFRFDDGSFYIKCFLSDNYIFADDLNENIFLLVKEAETPFLQPFPQELYFHGKKFKFLYTAHAVAEDIQGEEIFKKGDSERFWDYKAKDNSYLSLGINDKINKRLDFYGKIIENDNVKLEQV